MFRYRSERLYQQNTDAALRKHLDLLKELFKLGCSFKEGNLPSSQPSVGTTSGWSHCGHSSPQMDLPSWIKLLHDCQVLDGPFAGSVSLHDATAIFCWSRMVVVEESFHPSESFVLLWPDFLEAIARLADLVWPPFYPQVYLVAPPLFIH